MPYYILNTYKVCLQYESSDMGRKFTGPVEGFSTYFTYIRFFPSMNILMLSKGRGPAKDFATLYTFIRLLSNMNFLMTSKYEDRLKALPHCVHS